MMPKATVPPLAPMVPFQCPATLEADMDDPDGLKVAFQPLLKLCPGPKVQVKSHPWIGVPVLLVTVMLA